MKVLLQHGRSDLCVQWGYVSSQREILRQWAQNMSDMPWTCKNRPTVNEQISSFFFSLQKNNINFLRLSVSKIPFYEIINISQNYRCTLVCWTENIRIWTSSILVTNKISRDLTRSSINGKYIFFLMTLYMYAYQRACPPTSALCMYKSCFFCLTNGPEMRGWHVALQVIPVRLLHVRTQTAPSITGSPKINGAWKLCSKTVTAQFKVWPSENGGVRWKNYFMPCTKANATVQRDLLLIF